VRLHTPNPLEKETDVPDHIYRIAEIVGTSPNGVDEAVRNAVARANQTLRNIDWFEMVEVRGHLANGEVADWQVTVKIGFRLDDEQ
jgi:flavin-binding protein dodecin